ncbi:hypothetical protein SAMN06269250_0237 [Spirosoma fluviale]|uniref:Uncharacterized protein n=1 Tax=Spirosoma fluviale TaxID=1597977 RepID=A0A286F499_9BACT|nr:hypothetical protein SAMN06269250_0237 [Spirosoma fluviale]
MWKNVPALGRAKVSLKDQRGCLFWDIIYQIGDITAKRVALYTK